MSYQDLLKLHVSLDDSALGRLFGKFEDSINRHEQMILELQRLLREKPWLRDYDGIKAELAAAFDKKLRNLEDMLTSKFEASMDNFQREMRAKVMGLSDLPEITLRLSAVEAASRKTTTGLGEVEAQVRTIAGCYCRVSKPTISFEKDLEKQLNGSTDLITNNFQSIADALAKLQSDLSGLRDVVDSSKAEPRGLNIDLSDLNPRPGSLPSWRDPPNLPPVFKFGDLRQFVDYVYEMEPRLQGHLTALHARVLENVNALGDVMDRASLEELLEKLRRAIMEMDNELSELRKGLMKGLSRADVQAMISDAMSFAGRDATETAAGAVRCIACGRDNRQIAGALAEADAMRRFGSPPNSLAIHQLAGGNRIAELYSSPDQLQGIESPRVTRQFRAAMKVSKQNSPLPVPK